MYYEKYYVFLGKKNRILGYLNSFSKSMKFNGTRQETNFLYAYMHSLISLIYITGFISSIEYPVI